MSKPIRIEGRLGKWGCTDTHFGEQYIVEFTDGSFVEVSVWIRHGWNEKNNHRIARNMAMRKFPNKEVHMVGYA